MKRIVIIPIALMLIMTAVSAHPGPAADQAKAAAEALKGSAITNAVALELLDAWVVLEEVRTVTNCVTAPDPEDPDICTTTVDPYTTEEKAQFWINRHYEWNTRRLTEYRQKNKRTELKPSQDVIEAQVAAEKVTDL